jgi:hypothetical protein
MFFRKAGKMKGNTVKVNGNPLILGLKPRILGFAFDPTAWGLKVVTATKNMGSVPGFSA